MAETETSGPVDSSGGTPESAKTFQVEEISQQKRKWELTLHPGHVALQAAGETQPYVFLRSDFFQKIEFMPAMGVLALRTPPKIGLKLGKEASAEVKTWLGKPSREHLVLLLNRRYGYSFTFAVLLIVTSVMVHDQADGGPSRIALNPVSLGLGLWLLATWSISKVKPHPILFLVDGLWFFALAMAQVAMITRTHRWWWSIWALFLVWMGIAGINRFRQFSGK